MVSILPIWAKSRVKNTAPRLESVSVRSCGSVTNFPHMPSWKEYLRDSYYELYRSLLSRWLSCDESDDRIVDNKRRYRFSFTWFIEEQNDLSRLINEDASAVCFRNAEGDADDPADYGLVG